MTQMSFCDAAYAGKRKQTTGSLRCGDGTGGAVGLVAGADRPVYPKAGKGRRPYPIKMMLRIHMPQNWFGYSDPAMEEALYEVAPLRRFAGLSLTRGSVPDETTILTFVMCTRLTTWRTKVLAAVNSCLTDKGLLLRQGAIVDATTIHAPSSTK